MKSMNKVFFGVLAGLVALAGNVFAGEVLVSANITQSQTWTADNVYRLQNQVYVMPGATLTIEPGVVVASTAGLGGSLAVTRGAQIFVNGTQDEPVIMTSTTDVATWTPDQNHPAGADPKTGSWHLGATEWGNLTLMGDAFISASHYKGLPVEPLGVANTKTPTGLNQKAMEGLVADNAQDTKVLYGGDNDNDDSGSISYLSIRYGGKVKDLDDELNGLSLGGIGRETEIHHVEIMNNVDDGIEIWGGTVELKYLNIWNIGDDSFDIDEGWRGKAQFGLIVQGYSIDDSQGSGVGDNMIEHDGAEDSDAQPVTTAAIYNFTLVGQPVSGDGATVWRDGARVQHRNYVIMDSGEKIVRPDNDDGDGAQGYGFNGTLSFAQVWTTDWDHSLDINTTVNGCDQIGGGCTAANGGFSGNFPADLYKSQVDGKLAEISDTVFFRNLAGNAYTDSNTYGVTVGGGSNPAINNVVAAYDQNNPDDNMPIKAITRGAPVGVTGGLTMVPVTSIDPRAANDALVSAKTAPADGFFAPAPYRGAFSGSYNWLEGWTAVDAYSMTDTSNNAQDPQNVDVKLTSSLLWQSEAGVAYSVEESTDGVNYSPLATVIGDGSIMSVTDIADFDSAKVYQVVKQ